jgi:hypothetical protein
LSQLVVVKNWERVESIWVGKELELSCQPNIQPLGRYLPNQEGPDNAVVAVAAAAAVVVVVVVVAAAVVVLCSSSSELVEGEHKATH